MLEVMNEREQPVVDLAETNYAVLIYAAAFEGSELDAACGKTVANVSFAQVVLPPESKADRTGWHLLPPVIVLF